MVVQSEDSLRTEGQERPEKGGVSAGVRGGNFVARDCKRQALDPLPSLRVEQAHHTALSIEEPVNVPGVGIDSWRHVERIRVIIVEIDWRPGWIVDHGDVVNKRD
jgi:hypothetical protein